MTFSRGGIYTSPKFFRVGMAFGRNFEVPPPLGMFLTPSFKNNLQKGYIL